MKGQSAVLMVELLRPGKELFIELFLEGVVKMMMYDAAEHLT